MHVTAEDLAQTTLTKMFVSWRRISRRDAVDAYAYRTLVNTYLADRRAKQATGGARRIRLARSGEGRTQTDQARRSAVGARDHPRWQDRLRGQLGPRYGHTDRHGHEQGRTADQGRPSSASQHF